MSLVRFWSGVTAIVTAAGLITGCSSGAARPRVDGTLPRSISPQADAFVLIQGDHFARNAQVSLNSSQLTGMTWVNARLITALIPSGMRPGRYNLTVANPGRGQTTLSSALTVEGSPAAVPSPTAALPKAPPTAPPTRTAPAPPSPSPPPTPSASPPPRTSQPTRSPTVPPPPPPPLPPPPPPTQRATQSVPASTQPAARPTQSPTQPPQLHNQSVPSLAGQWTIVDTVTYGPGTGGTFPFRVTIQQSGTKISGQGDGISFSGVIDGDLIHASYTQDSGASGSFDWALDPSGTSFAGAFTNSNGNGGDSFGQRTGSATIATYLSAPSDEGDGDNNNDHGDNR